MWGGPSEPAARTRWVRVHINLNLRNPDLDWGPGTADRRHAFVAGRVTNTLPDSFGRLLAAQDNRQAELAVRFIW
jgi:hypothetical protein